MSTKDCWVCGGAGVEWSDTNVQTKCSNPNCVDGKVPDPECNQLRAEVARLKTVPMKYRRMEFNAQLQNENQRLLTEIEELRKQRPYLVAWAKVVNGLWDWCDPADAGAFPLYQLKGE